MGNDDQQQDCVCKLIAQLSQHRKEILHEFANQLAKEQEEENNNLASSLTA